MTIPSGLCQCGCGGATKIATQDDARYQNKKGEPRRFIKGHDKRKSRVGHSDGYVLIHAADHPNAVAGKVLEHVTVAERILGKVLPDKAIVHHVDQNRANNASNNLVILQDQREHLALHRRLRVLRAGGNPWTQRLCCYCHQVKDVIAFYVDATRGRSQACQDCSRDRSRDYQRRKREAA